MPSHHRDVQVTAEVLDPLELVVDEGDQGGKGQDPDRPLPPVHGGDGGEVSRLGLAGSGGGSQDQVLVGLHDHPDGGLLDGTEGLPALVIDIVADGRVQAVKGVQ